MSRFSRVLITLAAISASVLVLGFFVFAGLATREPASEVPAADAIVVVTGAEFRIAEGARLLEKGNGKRLFITGVNPRVSQADLIRITRLPAERLECSVDVDTKALDTRGNAREAKAWVAKHGFKSIVLVTSNFHMPRSTAEFALAMPELEIIQHPVVPSRFAKDAWWLHLGTARVLLAEYVKFLPVAVRLATPRALDPWQSSAGTVTDGDTTLRAAF